MDTSPQTRLDTTSPLTAVVVATSSVAAVEPSAAEIRYRPLNPGDRSLVEEALESLSERSRRMRFNTMMPTIDPRIVRYLCAADGDRHVAVGAFYRGRLVAMGRYVRLTTEPSTAEVSLTVVDGWQRRGVGPMLLAELAAAALEAGVAGFSFAVSGDNRPAQKLLARFGVRLTYSGGLGEGSLPVDSFLPPATAAPERTETIAA